jgi:hypothetical protein
LDEFEDGYKCCKREMEEQNDKLRQSLSELLKIFANNEDDLWLDDEESDAIERAKSLQKE